MCREVHLELLIQKCVRDKHGHSIGRISEIRCERKGGEWVIEEYLAGMSAALDRFSARGIALRLIRLFGGRHLTPALRIPWDQLDLSDPMRPRLRCGVEELARL